MSNTGEKPFEFRVPSTIHVGVGSHERVAAEAARVGGGAVLVITDANVRATPLAGKVIDQLMSAGLLRGVLQEVGVQVAETASSDAVAVWKGGTIYDPGSGRTYRASLSVVGENRIELRGYVGIPLIGIDIIRAVVACVPDPVVIPIILLSRIGDRRAVVARVPDPVRIPVRLARIRDRHAVVAQVALRVPVRVRLVRVRDRRAVVRAEPWAYSERSAVTGLMRVERRAGM